MPSPSPHYIPPLLCKHVCSSLQFCCRVFPRLFLVLLSFTLRVSHRSLIILHRIQCPFAQLPFHPNTTPRCHLTVPYHPPTSPPRSSTRTCVRPFVLQGQYVPRKFRSATAYIFLDDDFEGGGFEYPALVRQALLLSPAFYGRTEVALVECHAIFRSYRGGWGGAPSHQCCLSESAASSSFILLMNGARNSDMLTSYTLE